MLQLVYHRANSHKKGGRQIGAHNVDVFCELSPFGIRGEVPRDRCCDPFVPEGPQHVPTFTTPPSIFLVLLFPLLHLINYFRILPHLGIFNEYIFVSCLFLLKSAA